MDLAIFGGGGSEFGGDLSPTEKSDIPLPVSWRLKFKKGMP